MDETQTVLFSSASRDKKHTKTFAFDHCFWSMDESNDKYASQEKVYNCLGADVLLNAFEGYNACIFAYGQTGSGKTFTMMGSQNQTGLIPRLCDELFGKISKVSMSTTSGHFLIPSHSHPLLCISSFLLPFTTSPSCCLLPVCVISHPIISFISFYNIKQPLCICHSLTSYHPCVSPH